MTFAVHSAVHSAERRVGRTGEAKSRLSLLAALLGMAAGAHASHATAQAIPVEATFVCTPQQSTGNFGHSSGRWVDQNDFLMEPFTISVDGPTLKFHSSGDVFPVTRHGTHLVADLSPRHLDLLDYEEAFRLSWYDERQIGAFLLSGTRTSMSGIGFKGLMGRCELAEPS